MRNALLLCCVILAAGCHRDKPAQPKLDGLFAWQAGVASAARLSAPELVDIEPAQKFEGTLTEVAWTPPDDTRTKATVCKCTGTDCSCPSPTNCVCPNCEMHHLAKSPAAPAAPKAAPAAAKPLARSAAKPVVKQHAARKPVVTYVDKPTAIRRSRGCSGDSCGFPSRRRLFR